MLVFLPRTELDLKQRKNSTLAAPLNSDACVKHLAMVLHDLLFLNSILKLHYLDFFRKEVTTAQAVSD